MGRAMSKTYFVMLTSTAVNHHMAMLSCDVQ